MSSVEIFYHEIQFIIMMIIVFLIINIINALWA